MRKIYNYALSMAALLFLASDLQAQNQLYSSPVSEDIELIMGNQVIPFNFSNLPMTPVDAVKLVVYYSGDFGDDTEYITVETADDVFLGFAAQDNGVSDCNGLDSSVIEIPLTVFNQIILNQSLDLTLTLSTNVDIFCDFNFVNAVLSYEYCTSPVSPVSIDNLVRSFCPLDVPELLVGTPNTGTFYINNVPVTHFDPSLYSSNQNIDVLYSVPFQLCVSTISTTFAMEHFIAHNDVELCVNSPLDASHFDGFEWYSDAELTQQILPTTNFVESTTLFSRPIIENYEFEMQTFDTETIVAVDHNEINGDDRGLMGITQNHVYIVGDEGTARFNAADLSNGVNLPKRDGIFSDLRTGKLYSLWSSEMNDMSEIYSYLDNNSSVIFDGIREMDADLNFIGEIMPLLPSIEVTDNSNFLLSGYGEVGIVSAMDSLFVINILHGRVSKFDLQGNFLSFNNAENWAASGLLEKVDGEYVLLMNAQVNLQRYYTADHSVVNVSLSDDFITDYASFIYSPWNSRMYFHQEGLELGLDYYDEGIGYFGSTGVYEADAPTFGCVSEVAVTVRNIDLGEDVSVCQNELPYMIFAGNGYESYTWEGVQNNYNVYAAMSAGTYTVSVVDSTGCVMEDSVQVIVEECLSIDAVDMENALIVFPNPASSDVTISVNEQFSNGTITIVDLNGKIVMTESMPNATKQMDVQQLQSGVYLITVQNESTVSTKRFVKQ